MYILQVERNEISATYRASLKVNLEIRGNIFFYLHFSISIDIIDIRWYKSVILQVGKIILENRFDKYRSCEINENKYFVSVFFATDLLRRSIRRWRRRKRKKERERKNTRSRATLDAISLSLSLFSCSSPTHNVKFKVRVRFRCSYRVPRYHVFYHSFVLT